MSARIPEDEAQAGMSESKRRFFSGDTLQQALVQAANHYHLQPEEIAYRQIEKRHGFIKVRRKVVIEVDPAAPKREAAAGEAGAGAGAGTGTGTGTGTGVGAGSAAMAGGERPAEARPAGGPREPAGAGRGGQGAAGRTAARRARPAPPAHAAPGAGAAHGSRRGEPGGGHRGHGTERGRTRRPSGAYPPERRFGEPRGPGGVPGAAAGTEGEDLVTLPERPRNVGERYPLAEGPQAEAAAKGVELLLRIAGLNLTPHIYQGEERLEIDLVGSDTDWCFADDGELLMAIEHLLPRIIRSLSGEALLCRVDCDNFHEIREERLRSLAQKVADEVRQRGRSRTLVPMNPADRRIIHVTLADDPAVVTESEGEGYFKRITVRPA
jgi:predicted RNA-binding protein Jag